MRLGVVSEVKPGERRVALTPAATHELTNRGHEVLVERGAGDGVRMADEEYLEAGAKLLDTAEGVWAEADLVLKVKEPIASEYGRFRDGLILFTYLHLAADPALANALAESGVEAFAYETVMDEDRRLPLLEPMSTIAGRLAAQAGAALLTHPAGGPGILAGGAPGVEPARFLVIGGGTAGTAAALTAMGMGGEVTVLEVAARRISELEGRWGPALRVLASDELTIRSELATADVVIGAVLVPGARAPRIVTREMLDEVKPGAVLIDIAIDQGGCFESSRPTTHDEPTYEVDGVRHYCVANMPGAVPVTSTRALVNATLPYVVALAEDPARAMEADPGLAAGLNVSGGRIVRPEVREAVAGC